MSKNLVQIDALNQRGHVLLAFIIPLLAKEGSLDLVRQNDASVQIKIKASEQVFREEERSHQPSVFTVIRLLLAF